MQEEAESAVAQEPPAEKYSAALIVDHGRIKRWQLDCLENCHDLVRIVAIYSCRSSSPERRRLKHLFYYILNIVALRNSMTRKAGIAGMDCQVLSFDAENEGAWQKLPPAIVEDAEKRKVDFVIKFGMGLLRIPPELAEVDILSFHHGDPESYRGRPAGFYEIMHGASKQGVVVQKLTNKLDAGVFLARGQFKIDHHSYRRTAERFYAGSRHVFRAAILALGTGRTITVKKLGKNYRLPGNGTVVRFAAGLLGRKLKRILRGAFVENAWEIAIQQHAPRRPLPELDLVRATTIATPDGYRFLADPFFEGDGTKILAEGLSSKTHVGEIVAVDATGKEAAKLLLSGGHHSYPSVVSTGRETFILAETAAHCAPALFSLASGETRPIAGLEQLRLLDATHFVQDDVHFLFAGVAGEAADVLNLYYAPALEGPYVPHPMNPIVMDPECARMGGNILVWNGALYRLGQDNRFRYGSSLRAMCIQELSPASYRESHAFDIALGDARGPHTVNVGPAGWLFDFYRERFSLLAGYRRLRARMA